MMTRSKITVRVLAAALALAASACRSSDDSGGLASSIAVVAGANQQASVGTGVPTPPTVRVQDASGRGIAGVTVRFNVVAGGGSVLGDSVATDADGKATLGAWILGTSPGANTLRVQVPNTSLETSIGATAIAGTGIAIRSLGQQGFLALVGQAVAPAPAVVVQDSFGNPVSGMMVTFIVTAGGGTVTGAAATTNANGIAQVGSWVLGSTAGANALTAQLANGTTITFTAQGLTSAPVLTAMSPLSQAGYLGFPVTSIPRVSVHDGLGRVLAAVPVTFAISNGDGVVTGAIATSDANGIASPADWRIGNTGHSTLTASTGLGALPLTFDATGQAPGFLIDLRFLTSMSADQRDAFVAAARRWMSIIVAHLTPVAVDLPAGACSTLQPAMNETVTDVVIFAEVTPIDGAGGILGSASPCAERSVSGLTVVGTMQFDSADLNDLEVSGQLTATITHEMAHVLGFGTIWTTHALLNGAGTNDPTYTGAEAVSIFPPFAAAIGYSGTAVPVENCGGAGTRDAHWRETTTCGGSVPVFGAELMTGYIEAPGVAMPLSRVTIATMKDIGYQVDYSKADVFAGNIMARRSLAAAAPTQLSERIGKPTWRVGPGGTEKLP